MQEDTAAIELSSGGVPGDTEVLTTEGPVSIANLTEGDEVYALNPSTGVSKIKSITAIEKFPYRGEVIRLEARRVNQVFHPDHQIPYRTKSFPMVRFQRAGDVHSREKYRFINSWRPKPSPRIDIIDVTEFLEEYQICATAEPAREFRNSLPEDCEPTGYTTNSGFLFDSVTFVRHRDVIESNADETFIREQKRHMRRPYRFNADDFIRLIGWFVAEGSVTWSPNRTTCQIQVSQQVDEHRIRIKKLFERIGIEVCECENGFYFGSKLFGRLLEKLCGCGSYSKRLPDFIWNLAPEQQELLLRVLIRGDGNSQNMYFTVSDQLKDDVLRLCMEIGVKPRYVYRDDLWEVYTNTVNDRFSSSTHAVRQSFDGTMFRLTVDDYSLVMGGRDCKFQWMCVSAIS